MTTKPAYHDFNTEKLCIGPVLCLWNPPQVTKSELAFHRHFEFHYVKRGTGAYFIHNRRFPVAQNHLIIIKSGEIHNFIPSEPYTYVEKGSLYFPPAFVAANPALGAIIKKCPHLLRFTEKEATLVEIILKSIADETSSKSANWEEIIQAEIALFFCIVKRSLSRRTDRAPRHSLTERILAYLEQHFTQELVIADIAQMANLSMSRVSHLFKQETGWGVKHYILQRRIVEAKRLLTEQPELKVRAVATMVGFTEFSLFNRNFKHITGLTPTNYRRVSRPGNE